MKIYFAIAFRFKSVHLQLKIFASLLTLFNWLHIVY